MSTICAMSEPSIRIASEGDIAAVEALLARSYPVLLRLDYAPSVLCAALPIISKARTELVTCGSYYLIELAGAMVAAGGWTPHGPTGGREAGLGHVRHVVTDHRHVRCGYGRTLVEHVKAQARCAGLMRLECWSTLTAAPFYAALGFERLGNFSVPLGPYKTPFPSVRMIAAL